MDGIACIQMSSYPAKKWNKCEIRFKHLRNTDINESGNGDPGVIYYHLPCSQEKGLCSEIAPITSLWPTNGRTPS